MSVPQILHIFVFQVAREEIASVVGDPRRIQARRSRTSHTRSVTRPLARAIQSPRPEQRRGTPPTRRTRGHVPYREARLSTRYPLVHGAITLLYF